MIIHSHLISLHFAQAISLAEHDINDVDCELKLDYKVRIGARMAAKIGFDKNIFSGSYSDKREGGECHVHGIHRDWVCIKF